MEASPATSSDEEILVETEDGRNVDAGQPNDVDEHYEETSQPIAEQVVQVQDGAKRGHDDNVDGPAIAHKPDDDNEGVADQLLRGAHDKLLHERDLPDSMEETMMRHLETNCSKEQQSTDGNGDDEPKQTVLGLPSGDDDVTEKNGNHTTVSCNQYAAVEAGPKFVNCDVPCATAPRKENATPNSVVPSQDSEMDALLTEIRSESQLDDTVKTITIQSAILCNNAPPSDKTDNYAALVQSIRDLLLELPSEAMEADEDSITKEACSNVTEQLSESKPSIASANYNHRPICPPQAAAAADDDDDAAADDDDDDDDDDSNASSPARRRNSVVRALRDRIEAMTRKNSNKNALAFDLAQFFKSQREQIHADELKKKETICQYHGFVGMFQGEKHSRGEIAKVLLSNDAAEEANHQGSMSFHLFVVHDEYGILLLSPPDDTGDSLHRYDVLGAQIAESELDVTGTGVDEDTSQDEHILYVARSKAAHELFEHTGLDVRETKDRLVVAREMALHGCDNQGLTYRSGENFNFFLSVSDADFSLPMGSRQHEAASSNGIPFQINLSPAYARIKFENEPTQICQILRQHQEGSLSEAYNLVASGEQTLHSHHPLHAIAVKSAAGTMNKWAFDTTEPKDSARGSGRHGTVTSIGTPYQHRRDGETEVNPEVESSTVLIARDTNRHCECTLHLVPVSDAWRYGSDGGNVDLSHILRVLGAEELPRLTEREEMKILEELERSHFHDLQSAGRSTNEILRELSELQNALKEQGTALRRNQSVLPPILLPVLEEPGMDFGIEGALSDLDTVLSDLESHIDSLRHKRIDRNDDVWVKVEKEGPELLDWGKQGAMRHYHELHALPSVNDDDATPHDPTGDSLNDTAVAVKAISGGELYPASHWDMLEKPGCHLKNKILLADMDEVEVVAVILKIKKNQNTDAFDASLCVLNNEKPSSLKRRRGLDHVKNLRVKFQIKKESTVGCKDSVPEVSSRLCCWVC